MWYDTNIPNFVSLEFYLNQIVYSSIFSIWSCPKHRFRFLLFPPRREIRQKNAENCKRGYQKENLQQPFGCCPTHTNWSSCGLAKRNEIKIQVTFWFRIHHYYLVIIVRRIQCATLLTFRQMVTSQHKQIVGQSDYLPPGKTWWNGCTTWNWNSHRYFARRRRQATTEIWWHPLKLICSIN